MKSVSFLMVLVFRDCFFFLWRCSLRWCRPCAPESELEEDDVLWLLPTLKSSEVSALEEEELLLDELEDDEEESSEES